MKTQQNVVRVLGMVAALVASSNAFAMGSARKATPEECNRLAGTYELLQECTGFRYAIGAGTTGSCMNGAKLIHDLPLPGPAPYYGMKLFRPGARLTITTQGCGPVRLEIPEASYVQDVVPVVSSTQQTERRTKFEAGGTLVVRDHFLLPDMLHPDRKTQIPQHYRVSRKGADELEITFKDDGCLRALTSVCKLRRL